MLSLVLHLSRGRASMPSARRLPVLLALAAAALRLPARAVPLRQERQEPSSSALVGLALGSFRGIEWRTDLLSADAVQLRFWLNGSSSSMDMRVDCKSKSVELTGGDNALTQANIDDFAALRQHLAASMLVVGESRDNECDAGLLLHRAAHFFEDAPVNFRIRHIVSRQVACVERTATEEAKWTDTHGDQTTTVTVGSHWVAKSGNSGDYSCMGSCGVGCAAISPGKIRYTRDCLSHDACSWSNGSSKGAADADCGEAFGQAVDDYIFGMSCDVAM